MDTILKNFVGTFERIKNNFYFSFLAIDFLNQNKPFESDLEPRNCLPNDNFTAEFLNSFSSNSIQEYGNSIRRHFLNDMIIAYETYSVTMFDSNKNNQTLTQPATINNRSSRTHSFEEIKHIYDENDKKFLIQLRRLRNNIVHYNGIYSVPNSLNYTFGTETYDSNGKIEQDIEISFENLVWIYDKLRDVVIRGNDNYFTYYPIS